MLCSTHLGLYVILREEGQEDVPLAESGLHSRSDIQVGFGKRWEREFVSMGPECGGRGCPGA